MQKDGSSDMAPAPTAALINGIWRETRQRFLVDDPASGALLAEVSDAGEGEAHAAVDAAAAAGVRWASSPPRVRSEVLRRVFEAMRQAREPLARLIVQENGKTLADARVEVDYAAEFFRWFAEEGVRARGMHLQAPQGGGDLLTFKEPVGLSVLITPWNFPAAMAARKLAPALAAGCATVLKPASATPLTALALARILHDCGAPPGVVNVLPSSKAGAVSRVLLSRPEVRKLSFTGSTEVGRGLLALASERVINCSMELGGDAPLLVFDDADLDLAVEQSLIAKMRNGGQACTSANRFYVQAGVFDAFVDRFSRRMQALRIGPGLEPATDLGPLISASAQAAMGRVVAHALARGATLATGGAAPDRPGHFFAPTVLAARGERELVDGEVFGPVAAVMRFTDEAEAVRRANAVAFGLAAYVFTRDLQRGLRVARALEAGMVAINKGLVSDPAAPFGGMKQSGLGREGGQEGLEAFLETKYVAADLG